MVCRLLDNDTLSLYNFNASTGALESSRPNLTYQTSGFTPTGLGGTNCDSLSFNDDQTAVAGYDTANNVPASITLTTGAVFDQVNPQATGGFDKPAARHFLGQAFNPYTGTFWYAQALNGQLVLNSSLGDRQTYPAAGGNINSFCWLHNSPSPYVVRSNVIDEPNGTQMHYYGNIPPRILPILDVSKLPATNDSLGDIWLSDNRRSGALVAETPAPNEALKLYKVVGWGGEPIQIGPDLNLPLPQFNQGASEPQVIRYTTT